MEKKILLVDDDKDLVEAMSALMESQGYKVSVAFNKTEGLRIAREVKPDLIILDVQMDTKYCGFEFQLERSHDPELNHIPVLMNTGIEVMTTTDSVVDMIREMRKDPNFKDNSVLLVRSYDGTAGIDYLSDKGNTMFFYVDGFLGKPLVPDQFFDEINRILKK